MKKKLYTALMLCTVFSTTSCTLIDENLESNDILPNIDSDETKVQVILDKILINNTVTNNFDLPTNIDGVNIIYNSNRENNLYFDNGNAIVTRSLISDVDVTIIATVNYNEKIYNKYFNVTILKYDVENPLNDVLSKLEIIDVVTQDFQLPSKSGDVLLKWSSNNNAIKIEGTKAVVTQELEDVNVVLIVNATYDIFEGTKTFNVKVSKLVNQIDGILDNIVIEDQVQNDFELVSEINDFEIEWSSNNEKVINIIDNKAIVKQDFYDTSVILTATVYYKLFKEEKSYNILVVGDENNPLEGKLDNLTLPSVVYDDFILEPIVNGYDITYTSNNEAIIIEDNIAKVTKGISNTKVIITASISTNVINPNTNEEVLISLSKIFEITVSQLDNPIKDVLNNIFLPTEVTGNFELPTLENYDIIFISNHKNLIIENNNAIVMRDTIDINVSVIAVVKFGIFETSKSFNVTILKEEDKTITVLENLHLPLEVEENFYVDTFIDGVKLEYTSSSNLIKFENNEAIVKKGLYNEIVSINITATYLDYITKISYYVVVLPKTIEDYLDSSEHADLLYVVSNNLYNETYYKKESIGNTTGKSIWTINQSITNTTYKYYDTVYLESNSIKVSGVPGVDPTFYHSAYFDNSVTYAHSKSKITSSNEVTNVSKNDYCNKYGILADGFNFTGYLITNETINESSFQGENNGIYTFNVTLDNIKSSEDIVTQIKEYGNASKTTFSSIEFSFNIDKNLNIQSYSEKEIYTTTAYGINVTMTQTLNTSITRYGDKNGMIEVPNNFK